MCSNEEKKLLRKKSSISEQDSLHRTGKSYSGRKNTFPRGHELTGPQKSQFDMPESKPTKNSSYMGKSPLAKQSLTKILKTILNFEKLLVFVVFFFLFCFLFVVVFLGGGVLYLCECI